MEPTLHIGERGYVFRSDPRGAWLRITSPGSPYQLTVGLNEDGRVARAYVERLDGGVITAPGLGRLGSFLRLAEMWTGDPVTTEPAVRSLRGKAPSDADLIHATNVFTDERRERKHGAVKRTAERLHIDPSTLHRWRKAYEARNLGKEQEQR